MPRCREAARAQQLALAHVQHHKLDLPALAVRADHVLIGVPAVDHLLPLEARLDRRSWSRSRAACSKSSRAAASSIAARTSRTRSLWRPSRKSPTS
jgi:hypothetical protein